MYHTMGLAYGWLPSEVDEIEWVLLKGLLEQMYKQPPADMILYAMFGPKPAKPLAEGIRAAGIPVRKGRVKKRGNISR